MTWSGQYHSSEEKVPALSCECAGCEKEHSRGRQEGGARARQSSTSNIELLTDYSWSSSCRLPLVELLNRDSHDIEFILKKRPFHSNVEVAMWSGQCYLVLTGLQAPLD